MDGELRSWYIQYVPDISPEVPLAGKKKKTEHSLFKPNDMGIFYRDGMGCRQHENCFTCPFDRCKFLGGTAKEDLPYMWNRGNGIKP